MTNINDFAVYTPEGVHVCSSLTASQVSIVEHDYPVFPGCPPDRCIDGTRSGPYCELVCHPDSAHTNDKVKKFLLTNDKFECGQQLLVVRFTRGHYSCNQTCLVFHRPLLRTTSDGKQIYGEFNMNSKYIIATPRTINAARTLFGNCNNEKLFSDWITSLGRVPK